MSDGGQVADQMINMSLKSTETLAKLTSLGAEKLAVMLYALIEKGLNNIGKSAVERILEDGEPPRIVNISLEDLACFKKEAKHFGLEFVAFKDKEHGKVDIVVGATDSAFINCILEKLGYAHDNPDTPSKNVKTLAPERPLSEKRSKGQGNILSPKGQKTSVIDTVESIKKSITATKKLTGKEEER